MTRHYKKLVWLINFDENQSFSLQVHIVQLYVKVNSCMFSNIASILALTLYHDQVTFKAAQSDH